MKTRPNLPLDKKNISLKALNHGKEIIKPAGNNNEDIKLANIHQLKPITPNWTCQNRLLSKLSRNFREITLSKSKFPVNTPVLDTRYKHPRCQNNNTFYLFND